MKKSIIFAALAAAAFSFSACSTSEEEAAGKEVRTITGRIVSINEYGQPIPSFTPADMAKVGFSYADLMNVQIGSLTLHNVPYVSSFNEVAILGPSYVDYNAKGDDYGFAMLNGDFHAYIGGNVGDVCTMTVSEKQGYAETYELMRSVYGEERQAGETAEEYANFRMVTTTNIAPRVLYRSSNPLNCVKNPSRYAVADSLARSVGIRTEIDLADTDAQVETYMARDGYASTYCPELFRTGNTIACGMMANSFCDDFKERMGRAARFIIAHEPPYLIHCNEGKDRCGFVCMVLEALAGASVEELRYDYMTTMINFYKIQRDDASYVQRQAYSIDRMVWLMCHEDALQNYDKIKWDEVDVSNIDWTGLGFYTKTLQGANLEAAARGYLKECGLTDAEVDALKAKLTSADSAD